MTLCPFPPVRAPLTRSAGGFRRDFARVLCRARLLGVFSGRLREMAMLLGDFPIPLRRALRRSGAVLAGALGGGMGGVSPAGGEAESCDETGETSLVDSGVSALAGAGLVSGVGKDWESGVSAGVSKCRLNLGPANGRGVLPAVVLATDFGADCKAER